MHPDGSGIHGTPPVVAGEGAAVRRSTRILLVLLILGSVYLLVNLAFLPFGRDQGIYAMVADTFFSGGVPYRDAWDFKTPGIFFVFAAARGLFGPGETAFRLFEILSWLAMAGGFWALSARFSDPRAAIPAFMLAAYGLMLHGFWHVGQPESFGAVLITFALVLYLRPPADPRARFWAWALGAALYTCAALLKPPLGGGILVSFAFVAVQAWRAAGLRGLWRPILAHVVGGLAVLSVLCAWLILSGAWGDFLDAVFVFAPRYSALGHTERSFLSLLWRACQDYALLWPWIPIGTVLFLALGQPRRAELEAVAHIFAVIAMILAGVALQAKFFPYHFATAVAVGALPAGWGVWALWIRLRERRHALPAVLVSLAVVLMLSPEAVKFWKHNAQRAIGAFLPGERQEVARDIYDNPTFVLSADRAAARWLEVERPAAGEPSVFVWGFEPLVYLHSGLPPHNRYIYDIPMRAEWSAGAARAEFLDRYDEEPPWAILVQSNDTLPWVSGDARDSRAVLEAGFPELKALLAGDYDLREAFGPLEIYTRR